MEPAIYLSIIVPTYRNAGGLEKLILRVEEVMQAQGWTYELIFVNDNSPDNTWPTLKLLKEKYAHLPLRAINLGRNFGQHNALMCGLNYTEGQYIATLDDDLQTAPEELPKMMACLLSQNAEME
jgi:polyisoprenyl-phosphate glycosyltransferase